MKINKNSWHYKVWSKSFEFSREGVPEETDLCRYCHKVFWQLVGYALLGSMVLFGIGAFLVLLAMIARGFWLHPVLATEITAACATVIFLVVVYNRWLNRGRPQTGPRTLVGKFASANKQRVCPLVEFSEE